MPCKREPKRYTPLLFCLILTTLRCLSSEKSNIVSLLTLQQQLETISVAPLLMQNVYIPKASLSLVAQKADDLIPALQKAQLPPVALELLKSSLSLDESKQSAQRLWDDIQDIQQFIIQDILNKQIIPYIKTNQRTLEKISDLGELFRTIFEPFNKDIDQGLIEWLNIIAGIQWNEKAKTSFIEQFKQQPTVPKDYTESFAAIQKLLPRLQTSHQ